MKHINKISAIFSCGTFLGCMTFFNANAQSASSCHTGGQYQYCAWIFGSSCKTCPENCYCPPRSEAKTESCTGWTGVWCDATNHKIKSNTNAVISEGSFGIKICPDSHPFSDAGSNSAEGCYAKVGSSKIYNKSVKCNPGQYLPSQANSCTSCKSGDRYYCVGGTFHTSLSNDQGIKECGGGKIANSGHTQCVSSTVRCEEGKYLPANATACTSCKSGRYYVCEGGTFAIKSSKAQGIRKCDANLVANASHTRCEQESNVEVATTQPQNTGAIFVSVGQYLPANSTQPKSCVGAKKYCPGGKEYDVAPVDQGIFDCPFNGRTNATKSACTLTLTKNQMKYGPSGTDTECWLQTNDPAKYSSCVLAGTSLYYK